MAGKIIKMYCPGCKEERNFHRVVEAHIEREPFTMHTPMGSPLRQWVEETEHPTAYCPTCRIIVYVGPSADKVKRDFKKTQKKERTIVIPMRRVTSLTRETQK